MLIGLEETVRRQVRVGLVVVGRGSKFDNKNPNI